MASMTLVECWFCVLHNIINDKCKRAQRGNLCCFYCFYLLNYWLRLIDRLNPGLRKLNPYQTEPSLPHGGQGSREQTRRFGCPNPKRAVLNDTQWALCVLRTITFRPNCSPVWWHGATDSAATVASVNLICVLGCRGGHWSLVWDVGSSINQPLKMTNN